MATIVVGYVPKPEGQAALRRSAEEATLREAKLVVVNSHRGGRDFDREDTIEAESAERPSKVWKQYLYTAVANLNFTQCFTLRAHIYVIGTRANRIATMAMASYLIETIERLAKEAAAEVPGDERRRYRHSFAEGCAARLYERLEALQAEAAPGA